MKQFTKEMFDTLYEANKSVIGTTDYTKYHMEITWKFKNRWKFIGHGTPRVPGEIKTVRNKTYIITGGFDGPERYAVTDAVRELLNI